MRTTDLHIRAGQIVTITATAGLDSITPGSTWKADELDTDNQIVVLINRNGFVKVAFSRFSQFRWHPAGLTRLSVGDMVLRRDGRVAPVTDLIADGWLELENVDEAATRDEVMRLDASLPDEVLTMQALSFGIDPTAARRVPDRLRQCRTQQRRGYGVGDVIRFGEKALTLKDRTDSGFRVKVTPSEGRSFTTKETYSTEQLDHWQQTGSFENAPDKIIHMTPDDRDALVTDKQKAIERAEAAEARAEQLGDELVALEAQVRQLKARVDAMPDDAEAVRQPPTDETTLYVRIMSHVVQDELEAWERAGWQTECQFQPNGTLHVICRGRFADEPPPLRTEREKRQILDVYYVDSRIYGVDDESIEQQFKDSPFGALRAAGGDSDALTQALDRRTQERAVAAGKAVLNGS